MNVLLQTTKDHRQFLDEQEHWTVHPNAAHKFTNGAEALQYSVAHNLRDTEIFYQFDDPMLSFAVSVSEIESAALNQGFPAA